MPLQPFPELDRTSPTFPTDVDAFFGEYMPAFVPDINTLEQNVEAKSAAAVAAAASANTSKLAAQQAVTDAAAQVPLAANQVALAAAQVTLASQQADRAEAQADMAAISAAAAGASAGFDFTGGAGKFPQVNPSATGFQLVDIDFPGGVRSISAAGTVVATDLQLMLKLTGSFTLALTSAVTLGPKFRFSLRNVGTGVITLDPSGSQTIDARTTMRVYPGESFEVYSDGANFLTSGRSQAVTLSSVVISSAVSQIDLERGFDDDEIGIIEVEVINVFGSAGNITLQPNLKTNGSYTTSAYASLTTVTSSNSTNVTATVVDNGAAPIIASAGSQVGNPSSVSIRLIGKNTNFGQLEYSTLTLGLVPGAALTNNRGRLYNRTSGLTTGLRLVINGSVNNGSYSVRGIRQ